MKLQYKLWSTILTFGLLTIVAVSSVVHIRERQRLVAIGYQQLSVEAATHAKMLDNLLANNARIVATMAENPLLVKAVIASNETFSVLSSAARTTRIGELDRQWQRSAVDSAFVQAYMTNAAAQALRQYQTTFVPTYGEIFLTNRFGALVATTGKLTTLAHAHKYWWQGAYAGGVGHVYFDDRGFDTSVEDYVLGIVVPLRSENAVNGILKANVNILHLLGGAVTVGAADTQLSVARAGGLLVYAAGIEPLSQSLPDALVRAIAASPDGGTIRITDKQGTRLTAFAPVSASRGAQAAGQFGGSPYSIDHRLGNTNEPWYLIASRDLKVVTRAGRRELIGLAGFGLLVTMVIGASAWPLVARMESHLTRTETQLTQAFETAVHGMALIDLDGHFLRVNDALCNITGYAGSELLKLSFQSISHPDDEARDRALLRRLASGEIQDVRTEGRCVHKNGNEVWVEVSASLIRDQHGRPLHFVAQIEDISKRREIHEELTRLATTDPLTGLFNRRRLTQELEEEIKRARRFGHPVALILFDIDHFKRINDIYGHVAGDQVLAQLAHICRGVIREVDILGRIGGEEFALVLPESDHDRALHTAERLRAAVEHTPIVDEEGRTIRITISAGVATLPPEGGFDTLYKAADKAMYKAKSQGRNRVC